jgi:hypothetical protein
VFSYHCASEIQVVIGCELLFRSARVKLFCELREMFVINRSISYLFIEFQLVSFIWRNAIKIKYE